MSIYRLFVSKQAAGQDVVHFDLFVPTTSVQRFELLQCLPIVSGAVAVSGVVGLDLILTRTSAVGTGGTDVTYEGVDTTVSTFSCQDGSQVLTVNDITARKTPTGGATAGAVLAWRSFFTEETNVATYILQPDMARGDYADVPPVIIRPGSGIRVVQGAVASVGNVGFDVILRATPRP